MDNSICETINSIINVIIDNLYAFVLGVVASVIATLILRRFIDPEVVCRRKIRKVTKIAEYAIKDTPLNEKIKFKNLKAKTESWQSYKECLLRYAEHIESIRPDLFYVEAQLNDAEWIVFQDFKKIFFEKFHEVFENSFRINQYMENTFYKNTSVQFENSVGISNENAEIWEKE